MLRGAFPSAGESSVAALADAYRALLSETIADVGVERVAERSGLAVERVRAVAEGTAGEITLSEAAAILAADPDRPAADAIAAEARDILLMGMTTAVMDVDALAAAIDDALEPREIQHKVEGRQEITLNEYARLHHRLRAETV